MDNLKKVVDYFYHNPKDFLILILICIIGFLFIQGKVKDNQIGILQMKAYKVTPQRVKVVTIKERIVQIDTKKPDGSTTHEEHYIPPEGGVTIREDSIPYDGYSEIGPNGYDSLNAPDEPNKKPDGQQSIIIEDGNTFNYPSNVRVITSTTIVKPDRMFVSEVIIKDRGWCLRPGFGILYNGELNGVLDIKYYFINRYSALVFATKDCAGLSVSRHIDDLFPKLKLYNTEIFLGVGKNYQSGMTFGIGFRTNF